MNLMMKKMSKRGDMDFSDPTQMPDMESLGAPKGFNPGSIPFKRR